MIKLLSLTAPSGAGKTTLVGEVLKRIHRAHIISSYTTRGPRSNDLPNEYIHFSKEAFANFRKKGWFLWTAEHGGTHYGTTASSVEGVFEREGDLGIMILVPSVVPVLMHFLQEIHAQDFYTPVFIVPPEREILEERLRKRGDSDADIRVRLDQATDWLQEAIKSPIAYQCVQNNGKIKTAVDSLLDIVQRK